MSKYNLAKAVVEALRNGTFDQHLKSIESAVADRKSQLGRNVGGGIDRSEYGPPIDKDKADKIAGKHGRRK